MSRSHSCRFTYAAAALAGILAAHPIFMPPAAAQDDSALLPDYLDEDQMAYFHDFVSVDSGGIQPYLYNGKTVNAATMAAEWPATVVATFVNKTDGRTYSCTSTIIGPNVALTAAHCVGKRNMTAFLLNGRPYIGTCEHPNAYPADKKMDVALCYFDAALPIALFDTIEFNASGAPKVNDSLLLTGFGCSDLQMSKYDGQFRIGRATVQQASSSADIDLQLKGDTSGDGRAILCPGDSGGSAYRLIDGQDTKKRVAVGVNSRTNTQNHALTGTSFVSPTYAGALQSFLSKSLTDNDQISNVCISGQTVPGINCR